MDILSFVNEKNHGAPQRTTQKMPLSTRRSFARRTPRRLFGGIGWMAVHS
jgi:hypothetical protein